MRLSVSTYAAVVVAAAVLGCSSSPTANADYGPQISGNWDYSHTSNNPDGGWALHLRLVAQSGSITGDGDYEWIGSHPLTVTGSYDQSRVQLIATDEFGDVRVFSGMILLDGLRGRLDGQSLALHRPPQ